MAKIHVTPDKIEKLQYINKEGLKPGIYNFPDFLIIGPQRTGTTWLSDNLASIPNIFIPSKKELHFFNSLIKKENNKFFSSDRLEWYSKKLTPTIWTFVKRNIKILRTTRKINAINCSYNKYSSPFVIGEATATYAAMDEELVREIIILNPDVKIIMLIRHPVDRAWSHAKLKFTNSDKRNINEVTFNEFINFYTGTYEKRCGVYTEIIKKWQKYVKKENFFIGFFDDIAARPHELLARILGFLGVPGSENVIKKDMSERVINPTISKEIPESHKEFLFNLFKDEIQRLNSMFHLNW